MNTLRTPEQLKAALSALAVTPKRIGVDRANKVDATAVSIVNTHTGAVEVARVDAWNSLADVVETMRPLSEAAAALQARLPTISHKRRRKAAP